MKNLILLTSFSLLGSSFAAERNPNAGLMSGRYQHRYGFEHNSGPERFSVENFGLPALFACLAFSAQEPLRSIVPKTPSKAYDPLMLPSDNPLAPLDLTVTDTDRHRDIPIRVYLPADTNTAPVVKFLSGGGVR